MRWYFTTNRFGSYGFPWYMEKVTKVDTAKLLENTM